MGKAGGNVCAVIASAYACRDNVDGSSCECCRLYRGIRGMTRVESTEKTGSGLFLESLGVSPLAAVTVPFDPGYDFTTLDSHLEQSGHLMSMLKLSMACWLLADETTTRRKIAAARTRGVGVVSGGGPFEIAADCGRLSQYLDLCADLKFQRVEAGEGFTELRYSPSKVVRMAQERGLEVQFEVGGKHDGPFTEASVSAHILKGHEWLEAGAVEIVVEARESAVDVALFDRTGALNSGLADRFADELGLDHVLFEAPIKRSQFLLINHFGREVRLGNIRLEEVLRVEIYRRGLHSDAFLQDNLRPTIRRVP